MRRWSLALGVLLGLSGAVLVAGVAGGGGCAQRAVTGGCSEQNPCNPGYLCVRGECVRGGNDAGIPDAMVFPDSGTPDADICAEASFTVTDTQELFEVPVNARYMHVKLWGAGGNGEAGCTPEYGNGGRGGFSEGVFEVTPGEPFVLIVGKRGRAGMTGEDVVKFGFGEWGGGGLSGIFRGAAPIDETSYDRALIIAGGGGSAGAPGCLPGGSGNHPNAGGMPTMQGGRGGDDINSGGGGYRGGVGGARGEPAAGGTGFVDLATAIDSRLLYVEPGNNPPPGNTDPDYDGLAGGDEQSGLVILRFVCEPPPPL